jgi:hypothetical protein
MNNVTFFEQTNAFTGDVTQYALIDHGNEQFTSMTKEEYDRRQAEQSTPSVTNGD